MQILSGPQIKAFFVPKLVKTDLDSGLWTCPTIESIMEFRVLSLVQSTVQGPGCVQNYTVANIWYNKNTWSFQFLAVQAFRYPWFHSVWL